MCDQVLGGTKRKPSSSCEDLQAIPRHPGTRIRMMPKYMSFGRSIGR
ncbi:hypothetical protein CGRA01v4_03538 [Colletotrichum graminicola]|nr:hypothetical protein CGRA01v4_03538 [Colletotrichum graminicola]